jgi:4-aminobutyrate--pyruvate transaminase
MSDLGNSPASRDIANVIHPYTNLSAHLTQGPMILESGKGIYVYDDTGKEYIEGLAGLWSTALGFGDEELAETAAEQLRKLPYYHAFAGKSTGPLIDLSEKLLSMAPDMARVLFSNSGSEANDTLVKIVWYINNAREKPEKKKIISRTKGYHGVTVASASLTGLPNNHRDFDLPIANILHTDCPHHYRFAEPGESEEDFATRMAASLEQMIQDEGPETIAAFIAEPVMGAGGVIVPPATYFEKIQAVLKKYDVLMCADEVICGFGRTGNLWGSDTFGINPDTMTVAKALSSSYLPISGLMVSQEVFDLMVKESEKIGIFGHGFTYSGHPVCAAVALKTLEIMERRDIVGHVKAVAPRFQQRLKAFADHPLVGEARGVGLIGALELVADKGGKTTFEPGHAVGANLAKRCEDHGLIVRALGDTVAFCPPLIISDSEIDEMFDRFTKALDETEAWVTADGLRAA